MARTGMVAIANDAVSHSLLVWGEGGVDGSDLTHRHTHTRARAHLGTHLNARARKRKLLIMTKQARTSRMKHDMTR